MVAYGTSEVAKTIVQQPRGCWELIEVAHCPEAGTGRSRATTRRSRSRSRPRWSSRRWRRDVRTGHRGLALRHDDGAPVPACPSPSAAPRDDRRACGPRGRHRRGARGAGVHFPHDVVAGATVGVCVVVAVVLALRGRGCWARRAVPQRGGAPAGAGAEGDAPDRRG
ncbi:hypothetical protein NKG05_20230 [Oerskovia sp. M15]